MCARSGCWSTTKCDGLGREHRLAARQVANPTRALTFTSPVDELTEAQGHHPDLLLAWSKVKVTIWKHKIDGPTERDFVLAAKIEQLPRYGRRPSFSW